MAQRAIPWLVLLAATTACSGPPRTDTSESTPVEVSEPTRPNIVVYLVDTLRADHLTVYGYHRDTSPRLADFARDAMRFDRAYSPTSWTRPAVASLLTGLMPIAHRTVSRDDKLRGDVPVLGERLRESGYHTAAFVTNPNVISLWGFDRGFDHFEDIDSIAQSGRADRVTRRVLAHLDRDISSPFFLYVHTLDPHHPYAAPKSHRKQWPEPPPGVPPRVPPRVPPKVAATIDAYDREIEFNDHHFGALIDGLRSRDLYDDTLIFFVSDHGEEFFDHGRKGHGLSLYEEVVRIPFLVKFPTARLGGQSSNQPVSLLDVAPTVAAAAGAEPLLAGDGRDLSALLADAADATPRPMFFELDLLGRGNVHTVADAIVDDGFKYVRQMRPEPRELLFNLDVDAGELNDLSSRDPERTERMAALVAARRSEMSAGTHLWLVGTHDGAQHTFTGALRTDGTIVRATTTGFEASDELQISTDRTELNFRVTLQSYPDPIRERPHYIIDTGRINLVTEPAEASLSVFDLTMDSEPGSLFVGANKRLTSVPAPFPPAAPELQVEQMSLLFGRSPARSIEAEPGAYLGTIRPKKTESVDVDAETEARLRELGYID